MLEWLHANLVMVLAVLLGISEALALIPDIKANSVFQLIVQILKAINPKVEDKK
jgi:hypothetical protein